MIDGGTRAAAERAACSTARIRTASIRGVWWMKVCACLVSAASQPAGHVWLLIGQTGLIDYLGEPDKRIVASPVVAIRSATQEACQVSGLDLRLAVHQGFLDVYDAISATVFEVSSRAPPCFCGPLVTMPALLRVACAGLASAR
jgi:hypothetical protein